METSLLALLCLILVVALFLAMIGGVASICSLVFVQPAIGCALTSTFSALTAGWILVLGGEV